MTTYMQLAQQLGKNAAATRENIMERVLSSRKEGWVSHSRFLFDWVDSRGVPKVQVRRQMRCRYFAYSYMTGQKVGPFDTLEAAKFAAEMML